MTICLLLSSYESALARWNSGTDSTQPYPVDPENPVAEEADESASVQDADFETGDTLGTASRQSDDPEPREGGEPGSIPGDKAGQGGSSESIPLEPWMQNPLVEELPPTTSGKEIPQSEPVTSEVSNEAARLVSEAQMALSTLDGAGAEALLRTALSLKPYDPQALRYLGAALAIQNRYAEAADAYDTYLLQVPWDLDMKVEYARIMFELGQESVAKAIIFQVLNEERENVEAALLMGRILRAGGNHDEARKYFEWVRMIDPNSYEAYEQLIKGEPRSFPGGKPHVTAQALMDNADFLYLGSTAGWYIGLDPLALLPYLKAAYIKDSQASSLYGIGGGLKFSLGLPKDTAISGEGSALQYYGDSSVLDWGGMLRLDWKPSESVLVYALGHASTAGEELQSARSLVKGLMLMGGTVGLQMKYGIFTGSAEFLLNQLSTSQDNYGIYVNGTLRTMFQLLEGPPILSLGYRGWYVAFEKAAPERLYWSPELHMTHQAALQVSGGLGVGGWYYGEVIGGLGFERSPATATGEPQTWDVFPAWGLSGGIRAEVAKGLELGADTWFVSTHRGAENYLLWSIEGTLIYRW